MFVKSPVISAGAVHIKNTVKPGHDFSQFRIQHLDLFLDLFIFNLNQIQMPHLWRLLLLDIFSFFGSQAPEDNCRVNVLYFLRPARGYVTKSWCQESSVILTLGGREEKITTLISITLSMRTKETYRVSQKKCPFCQKTFLREGFIWNKKKKFRIF